MANAKNASLTGEDPFADIKRLLSKYHFKPAIYDEPGGYFLGIQSQENIDRPTMVRVLEDVFRTLIRKNTARTKILRNCQHNQRGP